MRPYLTTKTSYRSPSCLKRKTNKKDTVLDLGCVLDIYQPCACLGNSICPRGSENVGSKPLYPQCSPAHSPLVDSLSSRGSPGAWIVTDLSPRLPSRLFERWRSRRSLQQEAEKRKQRSKGDSRPLQQSATPSPLLREILK